MGGFLSRGFQSIEKGTAMIRPFHLLPRIAPMGILLLLGASSVVLASEPQGGMLARRAGGGVAARNGGSSLADRPMPRKPAVGRGETGIAALDPDEPFSWERAEEIAGRIERMGDTGAFVLDENARGKALALLPGFRLDLGRFEKGDLSEEEANDLSRRQTELENLEGIAIKGRRRLASYRPVQAVPIPKDAPALATPESSFGPPPKINTGWILDQHLFDPDAPRDWPTLLQDFKNYDEGQNDIAMGHSDHPAGGGMFGWMWQVQSFYLTETWADHPNASYCIFVLVSGDGGASWILYNVLYDPATSPATSKDLLNPKLAVDVSGTYDIFYIAYEYAYSATDHDVYVYYDTSVLPFYDGSPGGTSSPHDVAIATSANMEGNPTIASEYKTSDATRYQVVAYEFAASPTNTDIYAAQSYGNGSASWTTPVAVANSAGNETHPALAVGCSGGVTFTSYAHLAYNWDGTGTPTNSQLLLNPGFESGADGNWIQSSSGGYDIIDNTNPPAPRTGTWKAWLGGYNSATDIIYQTVTIPAGATSASFSYYLTITTNDSTVTPYDYLYTEVRNTSGALLATLDTHNNTHAATHGSYTLHTHNLLAYAGQTVRLQFRGTTDVLDTTNFIIDDTALDVSTPGASASEVRYANASHPTGGAPGATPYPTALASFTKLTVLANVGAPGWPYGPPAIGASHGGSATVTGGRVLVAADQLFPQDWPTPGDPERYQLTYAANMCNGSTGCGNISGCSPTLSKDWEAYYWNDLSGDYRYPSIVVDGVGWVQGSSTTPQNGVTVWPEMFMAYYYRDFKSATLFGGANMDVTFADEEDCAGFQSGAFYYFTASEKASDDDDLVVAKQGTLATFNYFGGWPGIVFNKNIYHPGGTLNDDPYFTTPGDNYTIDTTVSGTHIDAYWTFNEVSYLGPWTFAWPAGFEMDIIVNSDATHDGRYYTFSSWSTGEPSTTVTIVTDWCSPYPPCPVTSINALFYGGCLASPLSVSGLVSTLSGGNVQLDWDPAGAAGDVAGYTVFRATDCSFVGNYTAVGSTAIHTFTDFNASGNLFYYIIAATCGPYFGPWDHYDQ